MLPGLTSQPNNALTTFMQPATWGGYGFLTQTALKPWSVRTKGRNYARFEVREGDVVSFDTGRDHPINRAEMFCPSSLTQAQYPYDTPIWISMALRVPASSSLAPTPDLAPGQSPSMFIGQMHGGGSYSPVWAQILETSGDFIVATRSDWTSPPVSTPQVVRYRDKSFTRDVWHQFVYQMTIRRTSNGRLDMWHNGAAVFSGDIPLGYNKPNSDGLYFKFGAYRHNMASSSVVEYANVEAGTRDLSDRVSAPLPIP